MSLSITAIKILNQLADLVHQLQERDYRRSSETLSGATIGQHLRHTLEFFISFQAGYRLGTVNYDKRLHDKVIETERDAALATIRHAVEFVSDLHDSKTLTLEVGYDLVSDEHICVETNVWRELVYNIEHAVHHMALIKIAVREVASYVSLQHDFGIAASTIRYNMAEVSRPRSLS